MNRYNISIFGRNTITLPTPPIIPLTTRSLRAPSLIMPLTVSPMNATRLSIHSCGYAPKENVVLNMSHIRNRNIGNPKTLLVTTESIIVVFLFCSLLPGTYVSFKAPEMNPYFSSEIALSTSSPSCFFTLSTAASRSSAHLSYSCDACSIFSTSLSPSSNFTDQ